MLLVGFLSWWYGPGWRDSANRLSGRLTSIYETFSVALLLRTFFEPWRRIVSEPGTTVQDHLRALLDNFISRTVGACVRLITLFIAGLTLGGYLLVGGLALLAWPALPLIGPALLIWGVIVR